MASIGGSIFVKDAIKFDFCVVEAINSLLAFCDDVVVLECESEDDTYKMLVDNFGNNSKVRIYKEKWEQDYNFNRLTMLANIAREKLNTEWHFMLQADEVVHECAIPIIKTAIASGSSDRYMCIRLNIWGNRDCYIKFDSPHKPCGDVICRLAKTNVRAFGDAECLIPTGVNYDYTLGIPIVHYSFVRRGDVLLNKIESMQSWFFSEDGKNGNVDSRVARHRQDGYFDPMLLNEDGSVSYGQSLHLTKLSIGHPKFVKKWVDDHRGDQTFKEVKID